MAPDGPHGSLNDEAGSQFDFRLVDQEVQSYRGPGENIVERLRFEEPAASHRSDAEDASAKQHQAGRFRCGNQGHMSVRRATCIDHEALRNAATRRVNVRAGNRVEKAVVGIIEVEPMGYVAYGFRSDGLRFRIKAIVGSDIRKYAPSSKLVFADTVWVAGRTIDHCRIDTRNFIKLGGVGIRRFAGRKGTCDVIQVCIPALPERCRG